MIEYYEQLQQGSGLSFAQASTAEAGEVGKYEEKEANFVLHSIAKHQAKIRNGEDVPVAGCGIITEHASTPYRVTQNLFVGSI
ncbi:hypothetical protein SAMN03159422_04691 [Agrobacterium fabrum]|uniref:hypothetical protein n=1 Tax=Agrobacterium fabrum TaxID=1176649 RepID=UPI00088D0552|nr:hypothetical protein [Agrobacterium fabrum]SDB72997.1 hypothetical protein SAMN03159422_04691 [Agrobacterium fabrum]SES08506.1 hypothetical protein SAMN03159504_04587 [Agrobacterium fabrum]